MRKARSSIIVVIVIAMLLQISLPTSTSAAYASDLSEAFKLKKVDTKDTYATITWEFNFDSTNEIMTYENELGFLLEEEEKGDLIADNDTIIGKFKISEDGKLTVDIDDRLEEKVRKLVNDPILPEEVPTESGKGPQATSPSAISNLPSAAKEEEAITYIFKGSFVVEGVKSELALLSIGKDLENIFKNPLVTVNDTPLNDGSVIEITDEMVVKIHYNWELSNTIDLEVNDYAQTKLPDVLNVLNPTAVGKL